MYVSEQKDMLHRSSTGDAYCFSDIYALGKTLDSLMGKRKISYFMKCPELFLVIKKCCMQKEGFRFRNAEEAEKRVSRILKDLRTGKTKGLYAFLGAFAVFCLCSVLILPPAFF